MVVGRYKITGKADNQKLGITNLCGVELIQVLFYMGQNHKFASKGLILFTAYNTFYPFDPQLNYKIVVMVRGQK